RWRGDTEGVALADALFRLLPAACVIVIAAFSARRREEIESLREGCISDDAAGLWLHSFITKSSRDVERVPTCDSVKRAIEILEELSSTYRSRNQEEWLLKFYHIRSTKR